MRQARSKLAVTLLAAASAAALLSSCTQSESFVTQEKTPRKPATGESWTVMVYMSGGSDESTYGTSSKLLKEMTKVDYPESLNVVIETGGTFKWQTPGIDTNYIDRFEAQKNSLYLVERQESDSMARNVVLTDFIDWCEGNYPADHYALIISGSGSNCVYGAVHDETKNNEALTLQRIASCIDNADFHFDILGFDADLMASAEAASTLSTCAEYMIASQEVMASGGWNYRGWFEYIINNPTVSITDIARAACDTYMDKCSAEKTDNMASMSAINLGGITNLSQAIEGMAGELRSSTDSLREYSAISQAIDKTMCFGANTEFEGYSNMIDLNDLAVRCDSSTDKTSGRVQEELENSVIYRANGKFRENASGLSIFYPLSQSSDELPRYLSMCPFKRYADFLAETCANADHGTAVNVNFSDTTAFADYETERDLMQYTTVPGNTGIELNMVGNMDIVRNVEQRIFKKESSGTLFLGCADEIDENREAGIYKTKNEFSFPVLNGHNLCLSKVYECDDYTIFSAPIKVNSELKILRFAEYASGDEDKYKLLGLYDPLGDNSKSSRNISRIHIYDLLTPVFRDYGSGELRDGESFKAWPAGAHISRKKPVNLPEGSYTTDYSVEYIYGNDFSTNTAEFDYIDNVISYK